MMPEEKNKLQKAFKLTCKIVWWCVVTLLAVLLVNIIGSKLAGKVPRVFGYSVMNIVSASMEDEIPKGSYILVKKVDPEEIKVGDVICFYSTDPKIYGYPNTHRVVEEPIVVDGKIEFITKGDASPINDKETAKGDRLIGLYVRRLDGVTAFSEALQGKTLIIILIVLQIGIISMFVYSVTVSKMKGVPQNSSSEQNTEEGEDKK